MKRLCFLVLLSLFGLPLFAQNADLRGLKTVVSQLEGTTTIVGKQYAVLIAIDKYKNWMTLRNPVKDAKEIKEILSRKYFITDVVELYDEAATKSGIMKLFNKLINDTEPEDSVLIFYAGHGHLDKTSNTGFWIPIDGGMDVYEQANWLPNAQIRGFISNMKARHISLIADSCFSGDFLNPTRGIGPTITNEYFKNAYARVSRQVLTSGASESVPDVSPFTRQLKLALEGNTAPYLDPLMLYNQIRLGVTQTTPLFGDLKDSGHQEGSSFLLFLKDRGKQSTAAEGAASSAQSSKTSFKLEKVSGKMNIETKTTGTLLLDGGVQGQVPAGRTATIENLEAGSHELEMQYENGQTERVSVNIDSGEPLSIMFIKTFLHLPAQAVPAVEKQTASPAEAPAEVSLKDTLRDGDQLPKASIKIDGNFDDWKGIVPAFIGTGGTGNLSFDKVYLAMDAQNLYVRFDIKDATPSTFFHRHNFHIAHDSSYGLDLEIEGNHVAAQINFSAHNDIHPWYIRISRMVRGHWEPIERRSGDFNMKGSSLESSFPLEKIRKNLGVLATQGNYKVTARSGYIDTQWEKNIDKSEAMMTANWWIDTQWKWVEDSGDRTGTKSFAF